ncbi:nonstructural protein [robinz microvirus RP_132]|nr:nonstructural protein [robinz microvirus RP_132]
MKLFVFSVFDAAVGAHLQPFFSRSSGEAIRSFQDVVNDQKSGFNQHVTDYSLFMLGTFDDASGMFDCRPPDRICTGAELVIKPDDTATPVTWNPYSAVTMGQR